MIRILKPNEFEKSFQLSSYAFQFDDTESERKKREETLKPLNTIGYFVKNDLAAKLTVLPKQIYFNSRKISIGTILGVATWPEHRRQGMIDKLIKESIHKMYEDGQVLYLLVPFSYAFYEKYGWSVFSKKLKVKTNINNIKRLSSSQGQLIRNNNLEQIKYVYQLYSKEFVGFLSRDDKWWSNQVLRDNHSLVYLNENKEAEGYLIYNIKNEILKIEEIVYLSKEARNELFLFIKNHDSMLQSFSFSMHEKEKVYSIFLTPDLHMSLDYSHMIRVINVKKLLDYIEIDFDKLGTSKLAFKINDNLAASNNQTFIIENYNGENHIIESQHSQSELKGQVIECDIHVFAKLIFGIESAEFLYENGEINGPLELCKKLDDSLVKESIYVLDNF